MELEIGMYVRTINGKIWVITSQRAISGHRKDIINASYNIIDLIEVGDYVNGMKITHKYIDEEKGNKGNIELQFNTGNSYLYPKSWNYEARSEEYKIKSILTKEQFENMEYKVC